MADPYQVLGITRSATDEEVKKAYRELSRKYHPDTYADNPLSDLAEEKFKEVQEAYKQIMDMRSGQNTGFYQQGAQGYGGYQNGGQNGSYQGGQQYNRQQYRYYGTNYGRNPYNTGGDSCGTGNFCCDLWCADTLCECMGGDLCTCF